MKKISTLLAILLLPRGILHFILNILGHSVSYKAKIGFSFVFCEKISLDAHAIIGQFNYINVLSIQMKKGSIIGRFNTFKGPFNLELDSYSKINKLNHFTRGPIGISYGESILKLGNSTRITAKNHFDLTRSIKFGENSQVAGIDSQFWTHGYVHAPTGLERFRVDGEINIGNNVYLGSRVMVNPGVTVADTINVGGNSSISKSLIEPGMYVSQPLRHLDKSYENIKSSLRKIETPIGGDIVYEK